MTVQEVQVAQINTVTLNSIVAPAPENLIVQERGHAIWGWCDFVPKVVNAFSENQVPTFSWWYSWATIPYEQYCATKFRNMQLRLQTNGVEYVPMQWGRDDIDLLESKLQQLTDWGIHMSTLLGFNEPDESSQSNMTAQEAAALWPKLERAARKYNLRLSSPAPGGTQNAFMEAFVSSCNKIYCIEAEFGGTGTQCMAKDQTDCKSCAGKPIYDRGCHYDIVALHPYPGRDCKASTVKYLVDQLKKFGRPLWVTEVGCGAWALKNLADSQ